MGDGESAQCYCVGVSVTVVVSSLSLLSVICLYFDCSVSTCFVCVCFVPAMVDGPPEFSNSSFGTSKPFYRS